MGARPLVRALTLALVGLVGVFCAALTTLIGLAATEAGTRMLLRQAAVLAGGPERSVRFEVVSGRLLDRVSIGGLSLADAGGIWLRIGTADIHWRPWRLLAGELSIASLSADDVNWRRPIATTAGGRLPYLPLDLQLDSFVARDIRLAADLAGAPTTLSLAGHATAGPRRLELALEATWKGAASGHALVDLDLDPSKKAARLEIDASEAPGGAVGHLLNLPPSDSLAVSVAGTITDGDWKGAARVDIGGRRTIDSDLVITVGDHLEVHARGVADPTAFGIAEPAGMRFALSGRLSGNGIENVTARIETDGVDMVYRGAVEWASATLSGTLEARLADLALLSPGDDGLQGRGIVLHGKIHGPAAAPSVEARFEAAALAIDDIATTDIVGTIALAPRSGGRFAVTANGGMRGPDFDEAHGLNALFVGLGAWSIRATLNPGPVLHIAQATFSNRAVNVVAAATIAAGGRVRLASASGSVRDLSPLSSLAGMDIGGRVDFSLPAADNPEADDVYRGNIEIKAAALTLSDPLAHAALGTAPRLTGRLRLAADGSLAVENLVLAAPAPVTGRLSLADGGRQVSGALTLRLVPDGPLPGALHPGLSATGEARIRLAGRTDSLDVGIDLTAPRLALVDGPALAASAQAHVRIGADITGTLSADLSGKGTRVTGRSNFARTGHGGLRFDSIGVNGPGFSMSGYLARGAADGLWRGTVDGTWTDLAPTGRLFDVTVGGSGALTLRLDAVNGVETAEIEVTLRDIEQPMSADRTFRARTVRLDLTVTDPFDPAMIEGRAQIRDATLGRLAIARAAATISPGENGWAVAAEASGQQAGLAFDLHTRLTGAGSKNAFPPAWRLIDLSGRLGGETVSLERPARLGLSADSARIDGLAVRIGDGRLAVAFIQDGPQLDGSLTVSSLPAGPLAAATLGAMFSGRMDARLTIAGTRAKPEAQFSLSLADIRPLDQVLAAALGPGAAGVARLDGTMRRGRLEADAHLRGLPGLEIDASVVVDGLGGGLGVPGTARLDGRLTGRANLASLAGFAPFGDDRVAGNLAADLTLAGTAAAPRFRGGLTVADGRYESVLTGLVLTDLSAAIDAGPEGFRIKRFSAGDGAAGRFSGAGNLGFGAALDLSFAVDFQSARILNRDDARVVADGRLTVLSSSAEPRIAGRITVREANIQIPERLPVSVVHLDVVEINRPDTEPAGLSPVRATELVPVKLDIAIEAPARVFIRGRGLESEWRGAVQVTGTAAAPNLDGSMIVLRGRYDALGQRFGLKHGTLSFVPDIKNDALVDITAEAKAKDITAQIQLSGRLSNPAVSIASDPPLPRDEVVAQVLFGKSVGQLSALQAVRMVNEARALTGVGETPDLLGNVRQMLGVDVLDVDAGSGTGTGPSITVGRYIGEGVFLSVDRPLGSGPDTLKLEIEVTPNLSVETDVGSNADGRAGVNWRWNY